MNTTIKIGTRASKLALWQAYHIEALLQKVGFTTEVIPMETKGDKILDRSLAKIGSKGVFTEELEEGLRNGTFDIAVHSAKDMQSTLPDDLPIIAFTEREKANDVLISVKGPVDMTGKITIATSSTRRRALVKRYFPQANLVDVRGNLQTRIQKLRDGLADVLILAYAGVHRMGYEELIAAELPIDQFIPPVGQGCIAVQASASLSKEIVSTIRTAVNDHATERILMAERSFLRTLDGGCSIPVFGRATSDEYGLTLVGGVVSLDGQQMIQDQVRGRVEDAEALGIALAQSLLKAGADQVLKEIRQTINH